MANLLLVQFEENPHEENAVVVVAYFEGTPTAEELLEVQKMHCEGWGTGYDKPEQLQNVVADRAGLERWCLWY